MINADTGVHPDLLNSRFGYVSISRASHEATMFTDNMAKLNPQLSTDVSKSSALEVSQVQSIGQGIAMLEACTGDSSDSASKISRVLPVEFCKRFLQNLNSPDSVWRILAMDFLLAKYTKT